MLKSIRFRLRRLKSYTTLFLQYFKGYEKLRLPTDLDNPDLEEIELIWAKRLGNQLYQIENVPFLNDQVNLQDVVKCEFSDEDFPLVIEVIKKSGNRNLRVEFREETSVDDAVDIIIELKSKKVFYEKAGDRRYMFNVDPDTNYEEIKSILKLKEDEGILWLYE